MAARLEKDMRFLQWQIFGLLVTRYTDGAITIYGRLWGRLVDINFHPTHWLHNPALDEQLAALDRALEQRGL